MQDGGFKMEERERASGKHCTLLTTVLMEGFLSSSTWAISCLWGNSSSRRFRCAMCPTLSNELGSSIMPGSAFCRQHGVL